MEIQWVGLHKLPGEVKADDLPDITVLNEFKSHNTRLPILVGDIALELGGSRFFSIGGSIHG